MNAKDRYNGIVDKIEALIKCGDCSDPGDIAEKVCREAGCTRRDLSSVLSFMTGQPSVRYIQSRQMMAAYQSLLGSESFDIDQAIAFTEHGDQPAFNKAFRRRFQMTPTQAFRAKDEALYQPPLTWEIISDSQVAPENTEEVENMSVKTQFGVKLDVFERIAEAMDYQAMYGFTQAQGNAAYELAEKTSLPIKDCFAFVDNFCIHYLADDDGNIVIEDEDEFKERVLRNSALAEFSIKFDLSIEESYELMSELLAVGVSPGQVDPAIIAMYLDGDMDIQHFWYGYNWGLEHGLEPDEIPEFLRDVRQYGSLEAGLDVYTSFRDFDDPPSYEDLAGPELMTGHEVELQETDFTTCERFDEHYDIDNLGYDDTDDLDF